MAWWKIFLIVLLSGIAATCVAYLVLVILDRIKRKKNPIATIAEVSKLDPTTSSYGASRNITIGNSLGEIGRCYSSKTDYLADCPGIVGKYITIREPDTGLLLVQGILLSEQFARFTKEEGMVYELYIYVGDKIELFHYPLKGKERYIIETTAETVQSPRSLTDPREAINKYCSNQCVMECSKQCVLKKFSNV